MGNYVRGEFVFLKDLIYQVQINQTMDYKISDSEEEMIKLFDDPKEALISYGQINWMNYQN